MRPPAPHSKRRFASESGQAAVELAMVLMILLPVIFAMGQLAAAGFRTIQEAQLASSLARYAAVSQNPGGQSFADYVLDKVGGDASVEVCFPEGRAKGNPVTVTVASTFLFTSLLGWDATELERTVTRSATMRMEHDNAAWTPPSSSC